MTDPVSHFGRKNTDRVSQVLHPKAGSRRTSENCPIHTASGADKSAQNQTARRGPAALAASKSAQNQTAFGHAFAGASG